MIVPYDPHDSSEFYEEYYSRQVGNGLSVYAGRRVMDGDGIGSFLGGLAKSFAPALKGLAKSAVKSVGRQALNVAKDVARGGDFKSSAMRGLRNVGGDVMDDVFQSIDGGRKKRKKKKVGAGPKRRKRQRGDGGTIFD